MRGKSGLPACAQAAHAGAASRSIGTAFRSIKVAAAACFSLPAAGSVSSASALSARATEARKAAATLCSPRRVAQLAPSAQEVSA